MKDRVSFATRIATDGLFQSTEYSIRKSFEPDGIGYFEVSDGQDAFTTRRVHTAKDWKLLRKALKRAEARWPSKYTFHDRCENCWQASPCLAIRAWWDGDIHPRTSPFYIQTGCGEMRPVMLSLEQKLYFVRRLGIDAFIAWVDRSQPGPFPF